MRQLRTILRLRLQAKLSLRLSLGAVQKICSKAEALDLDWPAIEQLDDQQRHYKSSREARLERVGSICLHCSAETRVSGQGPVASDYVWVLVNSRKV